ncbi:MAG: ATP-dependent DNA helicase RecG, partial [Clostridia bacterium]|nr:ATP-dependent DNA helicase RecG [Clostridia bacterium]
MTGGKITRIKGVGEKKALLFERLGVDSVNALLHFYPRNYIDYSKITPLSETVLGEVSCVKATVFAAPVEHRIRKGMTLYKFKAYDDGTPLNITIFNNKYQAAKVKAGETYIFYGKIGGSLLWRDMAAPEILPVD